ncbi:MAG: hypothetical protein LBM01_01965 [Christensenellaceae bacterium]|jgi:hypothetical protein|nr:hypothetical protein [Christensenellaceae bacterium]
MEAIYKELMQNFKARLIENEERVSVKIALSKPLSKFLNACGRVFVDDYSVNDKAVEVRGRVVSFAVYVDENGKINSDENSEDFVISLNSSFENILAAYPTLEIVDEKVQSDANSVDVRYTIKAGGEVLVGETARYLDDITETETQKQEAVISSANCGISSRFELTEAVALDGDVSGVFLTDANAYLEDISVADGKANIKGVLSLGLTLIKDSEVLQKTVDVDFSQNIKNAAITGADQLSGEVKVGAVNLKIENEENLELEVSAEMQFAGTLIKAQQIAFASDAIFETNELRFNKNVAKSTNRVGSRMSVDVDGNLSLGADEPFAVKPLSVYGAKIKGAKLIANAEKTLLEGILTAQMVYEGEEDAKNSYFIEVPFSKSLKISGIEPSRKYSVSCVPTDLSVKIRRGKEIFVDAKLFLDITGEEEAETDIVNELVVGAPLPVDDSAINIHIIRAGETLWDVAKSMQIKTADLLAQNPELAAATPEGESVVFYRQIV